MVNAQTEELSGFEALVRWNHATRGTISPAVFIPLAEESGLILQIGEWVMRTACMEAAKWPENIRVAVNLSPIQFTDPNLPATIVSALANSQIQPRQLELEITEGVFLVESESTDDMFAKLKSLGVRLALDDFGTGYSSLGYLKKAPFDKIKIDQSFVRGAASKDSRNAAIIRAIVTLAESLKMDTTAEGAETHDELTLIRELGCSHIQGYIFGRPMARRRGRRARRPEQGDHRRRLPVQPATAPGADQGRQPAMGRHEFAGSGAEHLHRRRPARKQPHVCRPARRSSSICPAAAISAPRCAGPKRSAWASSSRKSSICASSRRGRGGQRLRRQAAAGERTLFAAQICRALGRQESVARLRPALLTPGDCLRAPPPR